MEWEWEWEWKGTDAGLNRPATWIYHPENRLEIILKSS
jgi:hypothetical protein